MGFESVLENVMVYTLKRSFTSSVQYVLMRRTFFERYKSLNESKLAMDEKQKQRTFLCEIFRKWIGGLLK